MLTNKFMDPSIPENQLPSFPSLPSAIDKITIEDKKLSYEDIHNLWQSLGAKYRPSIVYKFRVLFRDSNDVIVQPIVKPRKDV